jgi:hypothetical protein
MSVKGTPIRDTYRREMHARDKRTPVGDACLREMYARAPFPLRRPSASDRGAVTRICRSIGSSMTNLFNNPFGASNTSATSLSPPVVYS